MSSLKIESLLSFKPFSDFVPPTPGVPSTPLATSTPAPSSTSRPATEAVLRCVDQNAFTQYTNLQVLIKKAEEESKTLFNNPQALLLFKINIGYLRCLGFNLSDYWRFNLSDYWRFNLSDYWRFNLSDYWRFNLCDYLSKANGEEPMIDLDAEMYYGDFRNVVLLISLILPAGCLLPDAILASSHTINEVQQGRISHLFREYLSMEAKPLWDCLFTHFLQLIKHKVMTVKEVAAVFVPCLVVDSSDYQDKAYELLVDLLDKKVEKLHHHQHLGSC
ncbi:unnamed protein product [Mytilus edulis]|uniref:Centrosomal protein kizuna n=1 Tax=Mytilus edulis TaxID=6550 RepID=A0A8S3TP67_MYTED|nr:unnamed protein product [Mytilus edulis]